MLLQMVLFHSFKWPRYIAFIYIYIYLTSSLSISYADGHLGCFLLLAIVNSAAVNIGCVYLLIRLFFLNICSGVGLLDHVVILFCF